MNNELIQLRFNSQIKEKRGIYIYIYIYELTGVSPSQNGSPAKKASNIRVAILLVVAIEGVGSMGK